MSCYTGFTHSNRRVATRAEARKNAVIRRRRRCRHRTIRLRRRRAITRACPRPQPVHSRWFGASRTVEVARRNRPAFPYTPVVLRKLEHAGWLVIRLLQRLKRVAEGIVPCTDVLHINFRRPARLVEIATIGR